MKLERIIFLPRRVAASWCPVPHSALISIHDRSEPALQPQPGWSEVLWLRFHDTDGQSLGLEVFSPEQAQQVLDFAARHATSRELVVHCQMGQSRSAAVALFLSEMLDVPCFKEQTPVNFERWRSYNRKVYAVLASQAYGPPGSAFGPTE